MYTADMNNNNSFISSKILPLCYWGHSQDDQLMSYIILCDCDHSKHAFDCKSKCLKYNQFRMIITGCDYSIVASYIRMYVM